MTHVTETKFGKAVIKWFEKRYGEDAVETQAYLEETGWYCDVVVDVDFATMYVELENDANSVRPGMAQAIGYAGADPVRGVPMVVTPVDHVNPTQLEWLRCGGTVLIREFDRNEGAFVG